MIASLVSKQVTELPNAECSLPEWNEFVVTHPHGDLLQSAFWARVKQGSCQRRCVVLRDESGQITSGSQILIRRIRGLVSVAYAPYGPLLSESAEEGTKLVGLMEREARSAGASVLVIQPPRQGSAAERVLKVSGYRRAPIDVAPSASVEVDLRIPLQDIRSALTKSRRKNLKRAARAGVAVRVGDETDLDTFYRLHLMSAKRNGFEAMSREYVQSQWDTLGSTGHLQLFLAEHGGETHCAGLVTAFADRVDFKLTGWIATKESSSIAPNDAIQWAMIEWAKGAGYEVFDMGGLPHQDAERIVSNGGKLPTELGETGAVFKLGYGGQVVLYPRSYQKILTAGGHISYGLPSLILADGGIGGRIVNRIRRG